MESKGKDDILRMSIMIWICIFCAFAKKPLAWWGPNDVLLLWLNLCGMHALCGILKGLLKLGVCFRHFPQAWLLHDTKSLYSNPKLIAIWQNACTFHGTVSGFYLAILSYVKCVVNNLRIVSGTWSLSTLPKHLTQSIVRDFGKLWQSLAVLPSS